MKKSLKLLFCATALASLAGCNKFDEADTAPDSGNGSLIKVYAKVAENDGTRANIHVGESAFTAEWEAGDALGILPVKTGGTAPATAAKFDYNATSAAFEGSLNDFAAGGGNYYAFFPHAKVTGTTANLPFGNLRTQAGNDFNSAYDALVATPRAYTADDEAGKADGKDVTFTLTDAIFDAEGNCIEPFAFDLSSPNGIESLQVTVGSTNSQFLASMSAIQLPETFDLCTLDASSAAGIILKGFGYPVGSELKGQTAKSFNIAGQIRALYEFDGTHTFAFTMTDAKGVSSEAVLTLVVDKSSGQTGPRITWRGYDIDQQYEVQKDMVIDIDIEADKGIKSFFVTIDSETLRPLLPVINLPEKFDICDIPDELVEVLHGEFGFPINEQVKNRTSVTFSITKFVEILLEIPGEHNFVLDVTDNDNVLTHKTVKLIVH